MKKTATLVFTARVISIQATFLRKLLTAVCYRESFDGRYTNNRNPPSRKGDTIKWATIFP